MARASWCCSSPANALRAGATWPPAASSKPYAQRDLLAAIDAIEAVLDGKKPKRIPVGFSLFAKVA